MFKFETELSDYDVSVLGFKEYFKIDSDVSVDYDIEKSAKIYWSIEPEIRTWGIKDLNIFFEKVDLRFSWSVYKDDLSDSQILKLLSLGGSNNNYDGTIEGVMELDLSDFRFTNSLEISSQISPEKIDVYLTRKEIEIS
jgi:hypothetical protein